MSKTVVDGKEIIYWGAPVVDNNSVVEVTLTYGDDLAIYRFKFAIEETPISSAKKISDNEVELSLGIPSRPFSIGGSSRCPRFVNI
jgi:hypothetical protein